jgi:serine/alanine racemase
MGGNEKSAFACQGHMDRAWAEINLDNLRRNAKAVQGLLPEKCSIMAVVKANAYGHGDIEISRALSHIGIRTFAVATIDEGIRLRQNSIIGEILILGYTDPQRSAELSRYRLSQTVVDARHAAALNSAEKPVHVHIKVDTGMHRLGESSENVQQIAEIFHNRQLKVDGIFTHLCASESMEAADVKQTELQIRRFFCLLDQLQKQLGKVPPTHILSSYGALNYNKTQSDYARIGLALYGAMPRSNSANVALKPVLSLKARVGLIRMVAAGESIGYGCQHIVERNTRIAILPIGYADGIPRNLGNNRGCVLLHGLRAPIIGSICMDQLMVDITDIPAIECEDIATLIGRDGEEEILADDVASTAGTIPNEILSRLSNRLERVFIAS